MTFCRTLVKTLFDHVANKIVYLVEKQIDEVQDHGGRVKVSMEALHR